jgi:uncharacterized protein (TIGR03437 family)
LLSGPSAVATDGAGNVYVLDAGNSRIRKFAPGGAISTVTQVSVSANDMKLGNDGNFYLTAPGLMFKLSPTGTMSVLAGNGTPGFSGDGGPATQAQVGTTQGIALDSAGNIFFADAARIREITLDGNIQTVAGTGTAGYNGDNKPATSAQLFLPSGLAFDSSNNLYIADTYSYRIRKVTNGTITTFAGNGNVAQPVNGPATATPMGVPYGLAIDSSGNVFVSDISFDKILKIGTDGNLTQVAGTPTFGYSDGPANSTYLLNPLGLAPDGSGGLYIAETNGNRVRQLTGGNVRTIAGRLHYAGDGGPATSALLYSANDTAADAQGNVYILDSGNFRIRKVAPDGTITTFAGNGLSGAPADGTAALSAALPQLFSMTMDGQGNLYVGAFQKVYKISAAGVVTTFAGHPGAATGSGDGGPATNAQLNVATALAADSAGNIYVGDCCNSRVRKISADGTISAFAGTASTPGYTGDGGLATSATLSGSGPLTVDSKGNVYIGDNGNHVVRMVTPGGIISTVVGNGTVGNPAEGAPAKSPFTSAGGLSTDAGGNLYITSTNNLIYRMDTKGVMHTVSGSGTAALADGALANTTIGFNGQGIHVDSNGDLLVADVSSNVIRKLIFDSPLGLVPANDNLLTGPAGTTLPKPLRVIVTGRGGVAVPGVLVGWAVTSGAATVSANTSTTDSTGAASIGVTFGSTPGPIGVVAAVLGTTLGTQVTLTSTVFNSNCPMGPPFITSAQSAGDYGGFSTFAPGSWLEVKGVNLALDARQWAGADFQGVNAPTGLDGSQVSINGHFGFVSYISSAQINVQAPGDTATGPVQITVSNCAGTSAPFTLKEAAISPGLLAPAAFSAGGKQYLAATFTDGVTFVGNTGLIAGVPFRPAKPGDTIIAYGIGFGGVSPAIAPGIIVGQANSIPGLTISFGTTPASTTYAGLIGGFIGLYEFYITIPSVSDGDYQINFSVGGTPVQQTLYLTVHQ